MSFQNPAFSPNIDVGKLLSQLAGAFPVGFLGGAGYGSGLRFGFEKLFDATFKHIPTQDVEEVVKMLQGGFGIGQSFASNTNERINPVTDTGSLKPPPISIVDTPPSDSVGDTTKLIKTVDVPNTLDTSASSSVVDDPDVVLGIFYQYNGKNYTSQYDGNEQKHKTRLKSLRHNLDNLARDNIKPGRLLPLVLEYSKAFKDHYGYWA